MKKRNLKKKKNQKSFHSFIKKGIEVIPNNLKNINKK